MFIHIKKNIITVNLIRVMIEKEMIIYKRLRNI